MASAVGLGMQAIGSWEDVTPFSGEIVAYKADPYYFTGNGYNTEGTYFGYVHEAPWDWDCGEKGYHLVRLLKSAASGGSCALIASKLKSPISMRLATKEEISLIKRVITSDQAEFADIIVQERIKAILDRHLSKL